MRNYVVLFAADPDGPFYYADTSEASGAEQAIDKAQAARTEGTWLEAWPVWVAVPERNWTANRFTEESRTVRAEERMPKPGHETAPTLLTEVSDTGGNAVAS
jgi:hypothetical protein